MDLVLHATLRPPFGLLLAATIAGALPFPLEARAGEPTAAPAAAEPTFDPSPLPPIEPPRKAPPPREEPRPEATPEPVEPSTPATQEAPPRPEEPAAAQPPPPPEERAAALALGQPTKEEKRSPGCLLLQVGAFTSDVDAGLVAEAGLRVKAFSGRWAYRLMFSETAEGARREVALNSARLAWHKEFNEWTGGYVGAGVGRLEARAEPPWGGELMTVGTATVMVLDAGLLVEYGPVSLFGLGLELLIPAGGNIRSSPTVLLTATVSPLVILAAWK